MNPQKIISHCNSLEGQQNPVINTCCLFYQHTLTSIPTWISNYTHYKVWDEIIYTFSNSKEYDEIIYPFPNFNGATVEVLEWITDIILHFTGHVITYPGRDLSKSMLVKKATDLQTSCRDFTTTIGYKYWVSVLWWNDHYHIEICTTYPTLHRQYFQIHFLCLLLSISLQVLFKLTISNYWFWQWLGTGQAPSPQ